MILVSMTPEQQRIYDSMDTGVTRARLEPHSEVILRWRREGRSYRRIQRALAANGITIRLSALYRFVKRRSRPRSDKPVPVELLSPPNQTEPKPMEQREENQTAQRSRAEMIAQREAIRAVHTKPVVPNGQPKKEFVFDPDQPLINKNY
jgi:hypothetical protein